MSNENVKESSRRRRGPSFSILSLLLTTALIVVAISHFHTSQTLFQTQQTLTQLRNDLGELSIDDPSELAVIALPSFEPMQWRWRMHLPSEGRFRLRWEFDDIPESGLPSLPAKPNYRRVAAHAFRDGSGTAMPESPFVFTVSLHKDAKDRLCLSCRNPERGSTIPLDKPPAWLDDAERNFSVGVAGNRKTHSVASDKPLVLLRYRKTKQVAGGVTVDMQPTDGIIVWLEQVPSK